MAIGGCTYAYQKLDDPAGLPEARIKVGISVLLDDSIGLVKGKSIALLANQGSVDEKGRTDLALLTTDSRAKKANIRVTELFAAEHGLTGLQDQTNLPSAPTAAIPVFSLYGKETVPPPDSAMAKVDAVVVDLVNVGVRTWTYEGALVYTMRAAARAKKPVIVLDRPNPLTGAIVEGPILDSALANPNDPTVDRPGRAYAIAPIPLRHGMTFAELARYYNEVLGIHADLHVVPMRWWRRELWFDRTGLPFVQPSPNLVSFKSLLLYPGLVSFESTNLSVGRGTLTPFQIIGAPWLKADSVIKVLRHQGVGGVRFTSQSFTPLGPGDGKYDGKEIPGILLEVTDRSALQDNRLTAALLSALHTVHPTEFTVDTLGFDLRFGSPVARQEIWSGADPDAVIDKTYGPAYAFRSRVQRYLLY